MKLVGLEVEGFGKFIDERFTFDPGLNVVFGENESGKSTLANAVVACLYGVGRKEERDSWRPWSGTRYAARLRYVLGDGREYEVQREFERDPRGVRVYDRNGKDIAAEVAVGKVASPGAFHLGVPLEVFLNAACMHQQAMAIEDVSAKSIGTSLSRALDGGPREDAALGAIKRLDEALRKHVGTERATKNAPLRSAREQRDAAKTRADEARAQVAALDDVRARLDRDVAERAALASRLAEHERRGHGLRIAHLRKKIDNLHAVHDDVAALQEQRARYDDVAAFVPERVGELDEAYHEWREREALAIAAENDAVASRAREDERLELVALTAIGTLDAARVDAIATASVDARASQEAATATAARLSAARRAQRSDQVLRAGTAIAALLVCTTVGLAIAHWWIAAAVTFACVLAACAVFAGRVRARVARRARLERLQADADKAALEERSAAERLTAMLAAVDVPSTSEFDRRRARYAELFDRTQLADRATQRAREARDAAMVAGHAFDDRADALALRGATRDERFAHARSCAARARERTGIEASLAMHEMRRRDILGEEDAFVLERELDELIARGGADVLLEDGLSMRAWEDERGQLEQRMRAAEAAVASTAAELRACEAAIPDVAELDERAAELAAEVARLEGFERAATLARSLLAERTVETHEKFARRLEDYAARMLGPITGGRYGEIRIEPSTFALRVRVPETNAFVELDALSAGTREQTYLTVRFAIARMLSEGLERPPLLLDDPFAYWDAARIARCLPILDAGARDGQTIVFTSSEDLAHAASRHGANRIDLGKASLRAVG